MEPKGTVVEPTPGYRRLAFISIQSLDYVAANATQTADMMALYFKHPVKQGDELPQGGFQSVVMTVPT
jgi:hypothetical protein